MKGKKKSIGEIESGMRDLRKELSDLVEIINNKYPELSERIHKIVEKAGTIATHIANYKGKK